MVVTLLVKDSHDSLADITGGEGARDEERDRESQPREMVSG